MEQESKHQPTAGGEGWVTFPIYPMQFVFRTQTEFHGPAYLGGLFRGGFGKYYRDLICATGAPVCTGCPHLQNCAYSRVFETPVDPSRMVVLRKYPHAPHPFVLRPPASPDSGCVNPGQELRLGLTLIGPGVHYLAHFLRVFDEMGRIGGFGGKFRLETAIDWRGSVVFRQGRIQSKPQIWEMPRSVRSESGAEGCNDLAGASPGFALEFETPLRMRTDGEYNVSPDFLAVAKALLRRVSLLEALYGTGDFRPQVHRLMEIAERMKVRKSEYRRFAWSRMGGRGDARRRVAMDGVVGRLDVGCEMKDWESWMPWIRLGEMIHIGNGASMGLGGYRVLSVGAASV